jgi:hypothetical protein
MASALSMGYAVALPLSLPSLGVSSLDLGRLWQRRRPFFLCAPPIALAGPVGACCEDHATVGTKPKLKIFDQSVLA